MEDDIDTKVDEPRSFPPETNTNSVAAKFVKPKITFPLDKCPVCTMPTNAKYNHDVYAHIIMLSYIDGKHRYFWLRNRSWILLFERTLLRSYSIHYFRQILAYARSSFMKTMQSLSANKIASFKIPGIHNLKYVVSPRLQSQIEFQFNRIFRRYNKMHRLY